MGTVPVQRLAYFPRVISGLDNLPPTWTIFILLRNLGVLPDLSQPILPSVPILLVITMIPQGPRALLVPTGYEMIATVCSVCKVLGQLLYLGAISEQLKSALFPYLTFCRVTSITS